MFVDGCCYADGSLKLPLIVIGKSKNRHCFKNLNKNDIPVWYRNQSNACIDQKILEEWFSIEFFPRVKTFLHSKNVPLREVLLFNNCKAHKYLKVNEPNVSSLIQFYDQGILQTMKYLNKIRKT